MSRGINLHGGGESASKMRCTSIMVSIGGGEGDGEFIPVEMSISSKIFVRLLLLLSLADWAAVSQRNGSMSVKLAGENSPSYVIASWLVSIWLVNGDHLENISP